jgi:hypothetical protein
MRGGGWGVSANEYSCARGAQINFGNVTPYLTYNDTPSARQISKPGCSVGGGEGRVIHRLSRDVSKVNILLSRLPVNLTISSYALVALLGNYCIHG